MFKIAILGCENSHADAFLGLIKDGHYTDIEVLGVYTDEPEAEERMKKNFGVYCAKSYDEFVGKVDGIVITARDGRNHYKYAKPYIASGIPMFIDKPITSDEVEAVTFMKDLKSHGCRVVGGSSCPHAPLIHELRDALKGGTSGKVYGGYYRCPISMVNNYGNFFFYAQHLVEVLESVHGYNPTSVITHVNGNVITGTVRYPEYDVSFEFVDGNYTYAAYLSTEKGMLGGTYPVTGDLYPVEFGAFYNLLKGEAQPTTYETFMAPVRLLCAIDRSIASGKEEAVTPATEI